MNKSKSKARPNSIQYRFKIGNKAGDFEKLTMPVSVMSIKFTAKFELLLVDIENTFANGDELTKESQKTLRHLKEKLPKKYEELIKKGQIEFKTKDMPTLGNAFIEFYTNRFSAERSLINWNNTYRKLVQGYPYDVEPTANDPSPIQPVKVVKGVEPTKLVDRVTRSEISTLFMQLRSKAGLAENTVYKDKKNVKQFFKYLFDNKVIDENPIADLPCKLSKSAKAANKPFVDLEDFFPILDAFKPEELEQKTLFAYYRLMGARQMEPVMDYWEDISWEDQVINRWDNKRNTKLGDCPFVPELFDLICELHEEVVAEKGKATGPIFPWLVERKGRGSLVWAYFQDRIRRTGMEPWNDLFNSMRASRAREIRREPNGEFWESQWLGHTEMTAAESYDTVMKSDYDVVRKKRLRNRGEAA
jgi:hypothetical protein